MTIAAGFYCKDGVVLAADTEITLSGGAGKTYSSKMLTISSSLGCHATYAGSPDVAKELVHELSLSLNGQAAQGAALQALKTAYKSYWDENYAPSPESDITSMLVTLREGTKTRLYVLRNRHFVPVRQYEVLGIGNEQAEALFNPLYSAFMTIAQTRYMAIYGLRIVKEFVQGCGGETEIKEVENQATQLPDLSFYFQDIKEIEKHFEFFDRQVRPLIFAFTDLWVSKSEFQTRLTIFAKALKKRRAQEFKAHEEEMRELSKEVEAQKQSVRTRPTDKGAKPSV